MSLIVSVHVYSVQKALLKDSAPLYSVDYDAVKDSMKNLGKYVDFCVFDRKKRPFPSVSIFTAIRVMI